MQSSLVRGRVSAHFELRVESYFLMDSAGDGLSWGTQIGDNAAALKVGDWVEVSVRLDQGEIIRVALAEVTLATSERTKLRVGEVDSANAAKSRKLREESRRVEVRSSPGHNRRTTLTLAISP